MAKRPTLPAAGQAAVQRATRRSGMTQRAWRAQRKLTSMLPLLERYARAVLRDPRVRVHTTHQSSYTDGKDIYIQPPMMLGDEKVHEPGRCGVRSEDKRLICAACDGEEIVMSLLYHEVSHIAFGSYTKPNKQGRAVIGRLVAEWHPPNACDHGVELVEQMAKCESYMPMVGLFDPRLPIVLNSIEDARVNASMVIARPGTKVMLDARMHSMFSVPLEKTDGTLVQWDKLEVDAQVTIGMLLMSSLYDNHLDVFHEDAVGILADKVLVNLSRKISVCESPHELLEHFAAMFRRFQELGVLVKEKCVPQPDPDDEDQPDEKDEDGGEQPDLGSLGNEGKPSPSDGKGEGGKGGDEGTDDQGKDRPLDKDPTAGGGAGSSPGSGASESQGEHADSDSSQGGVGEDASDEDGPGSGDNLQGERDSGEEDDRSSTAGTSGDGHDEGSDTAGGDVPDGDSDGGSEPDGSTDGPGGGLTDAEDGTQTGEEPKGSGDEGADAEPADAEPEGGATGGADGTGEGDRAGTGSGGSEQGGEAGDGGDGEEELRDGGPDEGDAEPEEVVESTADYTPASLERLTAVLRAASLHGMFDDQSTEEFAMGHSDLNEHPIDARELEAWAAALALAGLQSAWFEGPSEEVGGIHIIKYDDGKTDIAGFNRWNVSRVDLEPSQSVVGPVVTKGRIAFSPNKRSHYERGLKSGRVNARALSKIPNGEERLFQKKAVQKKRSYHVIITVDVSGSTDSAAPSPHYPEQTTLQMMLRSVFAQAEALDRLGISFEVWAHTANYFLMRQEQTDFFQKAGYGTRMPPMDIWLLQVKSPTDRWDEEAKRRMHSLRPLGGNLDGHTVQCMRKRADEMAHKFTDVAICYYTDGAMPAANYDEEAEILRAETNLCRRKGRKLLAVGAGTDSPKEWGFDTVQIDSDDDFPKVMGQLERLFLN